MPFKNAKSMRGKCKKLTQIVSQSRAHLTGNHLAFFSSTNAFPFVISDEAQAHRRLPSKKNYRKDSDKVH